MKIVMINSCNFGSTGNIMLGIAKVARQKGHVCYTSCPEGRSMRKRQLENHIFIGTRFGRNLHLLLGNWTGFQGIFSIWDTKRFLKHLDKIAPDIIHLHNLHNCYINLPLLFYYIKKRDIPVIWTLHDCWAFTGQCPHFTLMGCDKWKNGCHSCTQISKYPSSKVDHTKTMWKWKKKWFTCVKKLMIVTPSEWLADMVKQSFLKKYPVKVINNGINLDVFKQRTGALREEYHLQENGNKKNVVLGVAFGWGESKGLDVFIGLAKRLNKSFQIILVGTDDEVDELLPNNIISIHRTQNQTELAEIYTLADVFINPTREDTYPTVNMEALACGVPVITFRTGGSPEIIDHTCGVVVECDDIDTLEKEIKRICYEKPFNKQICLTKAKEFGMLDRYQEYVKLYEGI